MATMDVEALPQQANAMDPVTITVREVPEDDTHQTRRRRPCRMAMIEPLSQLRKRKTAPTQLSSPSPKRNASFRGVPTMTHDHDCQAAMASDEVPSKDHKHRRKSVVTKAVDSIRKFIRKDSHQIVPPMPEPIHVSSDEDDYLEDSHQVNPPMPKRRRITPDHDEYAQAATLGVLRFGNASGFFHDSGEHGPSNYYDTRQWEEYHAPKEEDSERGKSSSSKPNSPEVPEAGAADVSVTHGSAQETTFPAPTLLGLSPRPADLFRIKTKRMGKKARGKRPEPSPEREFPQTPQTSPAKHRVKYTLRPTALRLSFDAPKPMADRSPTPPPSENPQHSSPKASTNDLSSPSPEPAQIFSCDYSTSFPVTRQPRPVRPYVHSILTDRPDTDDDSVDTNEHALDPEEYSHLTHLESPIPSPGQTTPGASAFISIFDANFHLLPPRDPSPSTTPTPRDPSLLAAVNRSRLTHHPNHTFIFPSHSSPSREFVTLSSVDEEMRDDASTTPLLERSDPISSDSRSSTPDGHHVFSRTGTGTHEQLVFPMSLGGSPVDLEEQIEELELRRMGRREALQGVSI
jgi:hypothetical protein